MSMDEVKWISELDRHAERLGVELIGRSDLRYETARLIYNRFHDLHPAALVRTKDAPSVAEMLRFAIDQGVPIAIRGGGHHIAGFGSCEGGVVLDFSPFREVTIDSSTGIVEVEPGARLGDVDHRLNPHGLVLPTGTVSETGIAGLTLGGGIGWLVGYYGLTCDQLVGADVILANGEQVRAEDPDHADLLWALRGGGGNFGVVTRLRYQPRVLPTCITGSAVVSLQHAAATLERTLAFLENSCPRELTVAPVLYRSSTGEPILSVDFCLAGADEQILHSLEGAVGLASWSIHRNADYIAWQSAFDGLFQPPMRGYWKSWYGSRLTRADIGALVDTFACAPTGKSAILIEHLHGAFNDTGIDTSSFPLRWARFGVLLSARWPDSAQDNIAINWVQESFSRLDPKGTSGAYSNYTASDDPRAIQTFGSELATRLRTIKSHYDPQNVFRRNHNLRSDGNGLIAMRRRK